MEEIDEISQNTLAGLPSSNEHSNGVGSSLENSAYDHECGAEGNSRPSSKSVGEIR